MKVTRGIGGAVYVSLNGYNFVVFKNLNYVSPYAVVVSKDSPDRKKYEETKLIVETLMKLNALAVTEE